MCDKLFTNPKEYHALDKSRNDVTNQFINKHISDYQNGNYSALQTAFRNELYAIKWTTETDEVITRSGEITRRVSDRFYAQGKTTEMMPGKSFEMVYSVSGTYTYDPSTHQILDYSRPSANIETFNAGAAFDYRMFNVGGDVIPRSDRVTFEASFSLRLEFEYTANGVPFRGSEDFGPYYGSVTAYA